nr:hypothetical protein [Cryptomonas sp. NIES-345]BDA98357.1 hypothetical protein [Cryptomonas sp. NIES-1327]
MLFLILSLKNEKLVPGEYRFKKVKKILSLMRQKIFNFDIFVLERSSKAFGVGWAFLIVREAILIVLEAIYGLNLTSLSLSPHGALRSINRNFYNVSHVILAECPKPEITLLLSFLQKRISDFTFLSLVKYLLEFENLHEINLSHLLGVESCTIINTLSFYLHSLYFHDLDLYFKASAPVKFTDYSDCLSSFLIFKKIKLRFSYSLSTCLSRFTNLVFVEEDINLCKFFYVRCGTTCVIGIDNTLNSSKFLLSCLDKFLALFYKGTRTTLFLFGQGESFIFLGYRVRLLKKTFLKNIFPYSRVELVVSLSDLLKKLCFAGFCTCFGIPISKRSWIFLEDKLIIFKFNQVIKFIMEYFIGSDNQKHLFYIQNILKNSCIRTLNRRHGSSLGICRGSDLISSKEILEGSVLKPIKLDLRKFSLMKKLWHFN